MGVGKKKARGPISKALKHGEAIDAGLSVAAQNYQAGVGAAGDRWVAGTQKFLSEFVPRVLEYYNRIKDTVTDPYERMRLVLKEESRIAAQYNRYARQERISKEISSFRTGVSGFSTNITMGSSKYPGTAATKKITI